MPAALIFFGVCAIFFGLAVPQPGSMSGPVTLGACVPQAYDLQLTNPGGPDACNCQAKVIVPAGLTAISATHGGTVVADGFLWNVGTLPADATFDAQFTVKGGCVIDTALQLAGEITYTACPSGTPQQQIISPLTVTVQYAGDHSCYEEKATMFVDPKVPESVTVCGTETFSFEVFNASESEADNLTIRDQLPPGIIYQGPSVFGGSSGIPASEPVISTGTQSGFEYQILTWDVSDYSLGSQDNLTVSFKVAAACEAKTAMDAGLDMLHLVRVLFRQDGSCGMQEQTKALPNVLAAFLQALKDPESPEQWIGDTFTWTLKVTNSGYGEVDHFELTDTLGNGLEVVDIPSGRWPDVPGTSWKNGEATWQITSADIQSQLGRPTLRGTPYNDTYSIPLQVKVLDSVNVDDRCRVKWGCDSKVCQESAENIFEVDIRRDRPSVRYEVTARGQDSSKPVTFCNQGYVYVYIVNEGTDTAHDVSYRFLPDPDMNGGAYLWNSVWYVVDDSWSCGQGGTFSTRTYRDLCGDDCGDWRMCRNGGCDAVAELTWSIDEIAPGEEIEIEFNYKFDCPFNPDDCGGEGEHDWQSGYGSRWKSWLAWKEIYGSQSWEQELEKAGYISNAFPQVGSWMGKTLLSGPADIYADSGAGSNPGGDRACWHFYEGSGNTVHDSSGNGNHGTAGYSYQWTKGISGYGGNLDNGIVWLNNSSSLNFTDNFTIEAWVKPSVGPSSDYQEIMYKNGAYMFRIDPVSQGGSFAGFLWNGSNWEPGLRSTVVPKPGNWYHVVMVYQYPYLLMYVNGKEVGRVNHPVKPVASTDNPRIGVVKPTFSVDEINLFGRALSASEIATRYNQLRGYRFTFQGGGFTDPWYCTKPQEAYEVRINAPPSAVVNAVHEVDISGNVIRTLKKENAFPSDENNPTWWQDDPCPGGSARDPNLLRIRPGRISGTKTWVFDIMTMSPALGCCLNGPYQLTSEVLNSCCGCSYKWGCGNTNTYLHCGECECPAITNNGLRAGEFAQGTFTPRERMIACANYHYEHVGQACIPDNPYGITSFTEFRYELTTNWGIVCDDDAIQYADSIQFYVNGDDWSDGIADVRYELICNEDEDTALFRWDITLRDGWYLHDGDEVVAYPEFRVNHWGSTTPLHAQGYMTGLVDGEPFVDDHDLGCDIAGNNFQPVAICADTWYSDGAWTPAPAQVFSPCEMKRIQYQLQRSDWQCHNGWAFPDPFPGEDLVYYSDVQAEVILPPGLLYDDALTGDYYYRCSNGYSACGPSAIPGLPAPIIWIDPGHSQHILFNHPDLIKLTYPERVWFNVMPGCEFFSQEEPEIRVIVSGTNYCGNPWEKALSYPLEKRMPQLDLAVYPEAQVAEKKRVEWDVSIRNLDVNAIGYRTWIRVNYPASGLSFASSPTHGLPAASGTGWVYWEITDELSPGDEVDFRINFNYLTCDLQNVTYTIGWGCDWPGDPADPLNTGACTVISKNATVQAADLGAQLTKSVLTDPLPLCEDIDMRVSALNPAVSYLYGTQVDDTLPNGASYVAGSTRIEYPAGSGNIVSTIDPDQGGNHLVWQISDIPELEEFPGLLADNEDPDDGRENEFLIHYQIHLSCDYRGMTPAELRAQDPCGRVVTGRADPGFVPVGGTSNFTFDFNMNVTVGSGTKQAFLYFKNLGPDGAPAGTEVKLTLPDRITYTPGTATSGGQDFVGEAINGHTITWTYDAVAVNGWGTITVPLALQAGCQQFVGVFNGELYARVTVPCAEIEPPYCDISFEQKSKEVTETGPAPAVIEISKEPASRMVQVGEDIQWEITVTNPASSGDTAYDVRLTDTWPGGVSFDGWTCTTGWAEAVSETPPDLAWKVGTDASGNLAPGAGVTLTLTGKVEQGATAPVVNAAQAQWGYAGEYPCQTVTDTAELLLPGSIGDFVWFDYNGDGKQDVGEPGIQNIRVTLTGDVDGDGDTDELTMETDPYGIYDFVRLYPGSYEVKVDVSDPDLPPGSSITTPDTFNVNLASGQDYNDADYGFHVPVVAGAIGDTVWHDWNANGVQEAGEPGIGNVTLELWNTATSMRVGSTITNAVGYYLFGSLGAGDYEVRVTDEGHVLTGYNLTTANEPYDYSLAAGEVHLRADFGYYRPAQPGSIGDFVWHDVDGDGKQDAGEPGIGGVTVQLQDGTGTPLSNLTTDVYGYYDFTGLAAGDYIVVVTDVNNVLSGYSLTTGNLPYPHHLTAGEDHNDADFGYMKKLTLLGSIGDTVWYDANENAVVEPGEFGIPGVTLWLKDGPGGSVLGSRVTNDLGYYLFGGLTGGSYEVDVDEGTLPAGLHLTTHNEPHPVDLGAGEDYVRADFGYWKNDPPTPTPSPTETPTPTPTPTGTVPEEETPTPTPTGTVPEEETATPTPTPTGTTPVEITPTPTVTGTIVIETTATPTPTPTRPSLQTPTPTGTPGVEIRTPTPTPCSCGSVQLELSDETVVPGVVVNFYACVPPTKGEVVDVYLLGRTPHGFIYSILFNGSYREGITPYYRGYINKESFCGLIHSHLVCEDAEPGEYLMGLLLTPAGKRVTRDTVLGMDTKVILKTR